MKTLGYLIAAFVMLTGPAHAQDTPWNCSDPDSLPQQGMNYCAYQDYLAADERLNETWAEVYPQIEEWDAGLPEDFAGWPEALLGAQRAWITFRDTHCTAEGFMFRGGTMEPFIVSTCKTNLTEQRIKQLLYLIETY
jgi:uncharacterized protein YecT (DUF1311 family)